MPVINHFPKFYKLKTGAYSYIWTDKCEALLPRHYKERCLQYMMEEPPSVHWIPDSKKYMLDKNGQRKPVQNHPVRVKYPEQCNKGLWAGEGIIMCYMRHIKHPLKDKFIPRVPKMFTPMLVNRILYSEILDVWLEIPCTNRAMDLIDEAFGLDYYILKTSERKLNSKLAMDLKRKMLVKLAEESKDENLSETRQTIVNRYKKFMIPLAEAQWVGLCITEALEKAKEESNAAAKMPPLKFIIANNLVEDLTKLNAKKEEPPSKKEHLEKEDKSAHEKSVLEEWAKDREMRKQQDKNAFNPTVTQSISTLNRMKNFFKGFRR